jgi:hypothetical protein
MKVWLALIPLVLIPLIWSQTRTSPTPAKATFELNAEVQPPNVLSSGSETVYTFSERQADGTTHERWQVRLHEEHQDHWIAADGTVWVITRSHQGPNEGSVIWARTPEGDLLGQFASDEVLPVTPVEPLDASKVSEEVDVASTTTQPLHGHGEQLRVMMKSGGEVWLTLASSSNEGIIPVAHPFRNGEAKNDLLTKLLLEPTAEGPSITWPLPGAPLAIWVETSFPKDIIVQTYATPNRDGTHILREERSKSVMPAYVTATPAGRYLWFEFGKPWQQNLAHMEVLTSQGSVAETVDLLKLGRFESADQTRETLMYRDLSVQRGTSFVPMDTAGPSDSAQSERIRMSDRTGREYQIDIGPNDTGLKVSAAASLNLDRVTHKEPSYPDAKSVPVKSIVSDDGRFQLDVKTVTWQHSSQTQFTLIANVDDPVQGRKSVQLWSQPCPIPAASVKVSNSGRVFALLVGKSSGQPADVAWLATWEPTGKMANSLDVIRLKWIATPAEAEQQLDLKNLTIELKGVAQPREVEGVPVPAWPIEQLTLRFNDGRKQDLYLRRMNDFAPSIYMLGRAK